MEEEKETLTNGEAHDEEDIFTGATVSVNVPVAEVLGRPVETEEDKELFLALISSFYSSQIVYEQLKQFVRFNMDDEPASPEIIVPEKKLILPG